MRAPITPILLARVWLLIAAALVIYRGCTQSLTIDEAHAYHLYLNQKAEVLFRNYEASYHVLQTWASWMAVHKFGKPEPVVRLPSMLAGLFYLVGVYALCKRFLGENWRFLVGVVLLTANPLIADYLSAARGYGAALMFFVWAFYALLLDKPARAGVLLALSAGCNLTFLIPAAAAGAVYLSLHPTRTVRFLLPLAAILAPVLAIPLLNGTAENYYYGAPDIRTSVSTLLAPSLAYREMGIPAWIFSVQAVALPLLLAAIVWRFITAWRTRAILPTLATGSLLGSLLILVTAHTTVGTLYPWTRTGLYLIWLLLFCCLVLWENSRVFSVICVLLAALFLSQTDTRYYYEFREDARVNTLMAMLRDRPHSTRVCIGGSWRFDAVVNYYRLRYKLDWIDEMQRTEKPEQGCQYFLLEQKDESFVDQLHLTVLRRDPLSGVTLAEAVLR